MWEFHDSQMKKLQKMYQRTSKQTQNRIQELIDTFNFNFDTLYNIANYKDKKKINTYIEEWQDKRLLKGQFGLLAKNIYSRTRVKNSEMLELLIYGAYIEEQNKLEETELNIMKEDAEYYYNEGINEVREAKGKGKKHSIIPDIILISLLALPNSKGYIWNEYSDATTKYNADQIYRQATIDLQQQKELDITSDIYQNIIKRQNNSKLNINGDKISGDIDLTLIGINNQAKVEGIYSFDEKAKVRFVAVHDKATTEMCKSLDNQIFNVHDWNEFYRYSKTSDRIAKYRCYGLIVGLNCPPIDDGFHWCRSTLVYNIDVKNVELIAEYNDIKARKTELMIDVPDSIEKFADFWYNNKGYAEEIKTKRSIYADYLRQVETGKEGSKATFDKYYHNYLEAQKIDKIITKDGIKVGKVQPHTLYRLSGRDLDIKEMVDILESAEGVLDKKHNSILYTLDKKVIVSIGDDDNHNIKTIMKSRGGGK